MRTPRRGISSIKLLVSLPAILAFAWLGLEFGLVLRAIQQAKIAADSAALAAAARLTSDFEVYGEAAIQAASANAGPSGNMIISVAADNAGGDLLTGTWDPESRLFTPDPNARQAVSVTVRIGAGAPNESPGYILPNILELTEATFERTSVATMTALPAAASLLATNDSSPRSMELGGNALLDSFGDIEVASVHPNAVRLRGNASIIVPTLRTAGGLQGNSGDAVDGAIETNALILDDPYQSIPVPDLLPVTETPDFFDPTSVTPLEPGRHPNGLVLDQGTVRLLPGVHQFAGPGLKITQEAEIELVDATIQLLDNASLQIQDKASLNGTPPLGGPWDDVFLIAPETNIVTVTGAGTLIVPGVAYCPKAATRFEDDAAMVIDGMVTGKLIQQHHSNLRLDRVIIAAPVKNAARALLRQ